MNLYHSKLWMSDLDETIAALPELAELEGRSVMITGCSGLICSAVIDVLIRRNETHSGQIHIIAAGRNLLRIAERFSPFSSKGYFSAFEYDATRENDFCYSCDYIIHGASNASPNKIIREPVETMVGNFMGMKHLPDYAIQQKIRRVLYISTSEVYGHKLHDRPSREGEYGGIDLLNPRSSYSIGKCAAETLCASYADEYGVDSVIIRPGHIYGPTAVRSDNRVSSAWAYMVADGKDIVMKSDGSQIRSYCYCLDSASAILKALLEGEATHAYNISNPDSIISIREMAEILTRSAGVALKTEAPTESEKRGFNPMRDSSLDSTELHALGWKGLFDARRGFSHTVEILKEISADADAI